MPDYLPGYDAWKTTPPDDDGDDLVFCRQHGSWSPPDRDCDACLEDLAADNADARAAYLDHRAEQDPGPMTVHDLNPEPRNHHANRAVQKMRS